MATSLILVAAAILAYRSFNSTERLAWDQSSFYDAVMEADYEGLGWGRRFELI